MQQPRESHRPLDRGGHQEQPAHPAGQNTPEPGGSKRHSVSITNVSDFDDLICEETDNSFWVSDCIYPVVPLIDESASDFT